MLNKCSLFKNSGTHHTNDIYLLTYWSFHQTWGFLKLEITSLIFPQLPLLVPICMQFPVWRAFCASPQQTFTTTYMIRIRISMLWFNKKAQRAKIPIPHPSAASRRSQDFDSLFHCQVCEPFITYPCLSRCGPHRHSELSKYLMNRIQSNKSRTHPCLSERDTGLSVPLKFWMWP